MIEEVASETEIENLYKESSNGPYQKIANGHGYYGVLIRNKNDLKIQCHICGKWFKSLANHSSHAHKLRAREYKKQFGFPQIFPLCWEPLSRAFSQRAHKLKCWEFPRNKGKIFSEGDRRRQGSPRGPRHFSMSYINSHAICDEQITRRVLAVSDVVGHVPSLRDMAIYDEAARAFIIRKYKTWNNFKRLNHFGDIKEKPPTFDSESILILLRQFKEKFGKVPSSMELRKSIPGYPTHSAILNRFGSWQRALSLAGFSTVYQGQCLNCKQDFQKRAYLDVYCSEDCRKKHYKVNGNMSRYYRKYRLKRKILRLSHKTEAVPPASGVSVAIPPRAQGRTG